MPRMKIVDIYYNKKFFIFLCCTFLFLYLVFSMPSMARKYTIEELSFTNSRFLAVEGTTLHYRLWQPNASFLKGNVILLHGLGGSTYSWRFVAPVLVEKGYRVLVVDLPGFGLSERNAAVRQSHENRAKLLWKLIESLDFGGPWHLVGHSMGGGVVASMALQKQTNTASIILVAGSIDGDDRRVGAILSRCRIIRKITARVVDRFFLTRKRIKSFLYSAYKRKPTAEEVEGYYQPLQLEKTYLTLDSLLRRYPEDKDLSDRIAEINLPVLCFWGSRDEWVPVSKGEDLRQKMPKASLFVIEEAGHCPMETHPEIFNQYLIDFLSEIKIDESTASISLP